MSYLEEYRQTLLFEEKNQKVFLYARNWWRPNKVGIFVERKNAAYAISIRTDMEIDSYERLVGRSFRNLKSSKMQRTPKYFIDAVSSIGPKCKGLTYDKAIERFMDPSISPNSGM